VQLRPAFVAPPLSATQVAKVQPRMAKQLTSLGLVSAQVELVDGTAILRGIVPTERDRELIARMASLEPGVSRVENLVTIQPPPGPALR
jgi:osmotically-inducible protein OsmY